MNTILRKVGCIGLAVMVLLTGVTAPVTAQTNNGLPEGCSQLDNFIHDLLTFQNVNEGNSDCSTQSQVNSAIEDMKQSDANQTKVDIYNAAITEKSQSETFGATYDNYLQDTDSVAWMKMQVAVAEAYKNGKLKVQARVDAREAISDYYYIKQKNLVERWNQTVTTTAYLKNQAKNETDISNDFVEVYGQTGSDYHGLSFPVDPIPGDTTTKTVTTVNDSLITTKGIKVNINSGGSGTLTVNSGYYVDGHPNNNAIVKGIRVKAPNQNYNGKQFVNPKEYQERWNKIETQNSNLQAEASNFVNATYDDFKSGEINASDVISANTAMFEYGTTSTENKSLYNSVGALSLMGYDTPNLNNTGTFVISYNNNTYEGIVLAKNVPNGTWETGKTYNASNITGPVFVATTNGNKIDILGKFTIKSITTENGESVSNIETQKYNYKTSNTSELQEVTDQLIQLRKDIESREIKASSGGSGDTSNTPNINIPDWLTKTYFNIPTYGYIGVGVVGLYVISARKQN